ncbi:16S rRNA (adenine(1518)-N(6)/adenine(1519)-N(6))-dimethyltransferase RsmA [Lautropia mirabilis]|jgi:dimethyladenosine transferase|uniref:16S rRNA (adenine(1518)-N(6)/adenine(1519)-N(6))- dimethyltransferase RsmA n=1 Tax=Lautropia mirabilis TaxID=47671 RepID=UPI001CB10FE0|nr:16S rRNA (adenine(1518)-N(6)/adenine(1519)-N(6))-dimethyltransferase RsmA [Lautropia mirabilis]MBF1234623.1 16S rRNA (adenine(1518)-N(6)/adenine(1519)-N(6))-dimethyltransferase RsmA [Lautropia mirabilis]MBF1257708.1 16S rRNA (adenine(1518)-N(6)/adenine(1519)-N(6))-dimethyltransferase RsmA [Lautropia mirabilis]MDC6092796.1 16S rRNA (adenine(1518)-N(6)/adenine(1519)-N(6))-dimethyltransferase RsmA [Lautropia mirabilis]
MANHRHDAGREKRPAGVIPRKRFGQHFLADRACIDAIVQAIAPRSGDNLVEIGPGTGVLTAPLVAQTGHLTVIEIDRDLGPRLAAQYGDALTLVQQDVLQVDFSGFGQNLRIVGNLPYNISSPLLLHLIAVADRVRDQHFMLQKEVVDRMVAGPGSDMGRLTVFLQNHYQVVKLFDVPPEAFDPPPKVDSSVVRMVPLPRPHTTAIAQLEAALAAAYAQRRKMLRRTLGSWLAQQHPSFDLEKAAADDARLVPLTDLSQRPEQIPATAWYALADALAARPLG